MGLESLPPLARNSMLREEVSFESRGIPCVGDFYWPEHLTGPVPCLVMGHGGSGTKRLGLPIYAKRFVEELGIAVFAFDYRHFGKSGGEPRQLLDIESQQEDYRSAIRFVRNNKNIDPERVALWGTSFSGGHVLVVAAEDPRIAAVISQVPLIDGRYRGRTVKEDLSWKITKLRLKYIWAAIVDIVGSWFGRPPHFVPVYAAPGELAAFIEPEAKQALEAMGGEAVGWKNALAPRFFFKMYFRGLPKYIECAAEKLHMALLTCVADKDTQASSDFAATVASKASRGEVKHYGVSHFEVYLSPTIDRMISDQAQFLRPALTAVGR